MEKKQYEEFINELDDNHLNKLLDAANGRLDGTDIQELEEYIIPSIARLIQMCGGDPLGNGQLDTPYRVVKAWFELSRGYTEDPTKHLLTAFDLDEGDKETDLDDMVIVENITMKSVCEHHILPFIGVIHIGYIPDGKIIGLSKFSRLVKGISNRFQVQEKITQEVAEAIMDIGAKGVVVYGSAVHTCMISRGIEEHNTNTITIATRGAFRDDKMLEQKFLTAVGGK